ncbi:MAG: hypothetical protein WAV95_14955 [Azonexus sp.]
MSIANQLDGERIAQDVARQQLALDLLDRHPGKFTQWDYLLSIVFGAAMGGFNAISQGQYALVVVGVMAGTGFFLSGVVFQQTLRLHRRLEAALVLLRKKESLGE